MVSKPALTLKGKIIKKKLDKVRNKKSEHYGNTYYRLQVNIENKPKITEILVFENWLDKKNIYQELTSWKDYDKNYLFTCQRKPGAGEVYRLTNWEKLNHHGSN